MKTLIVLIGIVFIVGGGFFIYDAIQTKQTVTAKVEKEFSNALKIISNDSIKSNTKINNNSDIKIIGGSAAVVSGLVLIIIGLRKSSK